MAVYVDSLFATEPRPEWPFKFACHMLADSREELDATALAIGLKLRWRQDSGKPTEHYDLTAGKRAAALKNGAVRIGRRELVAIVRAKREAKA